ncbi:MAG: UDP-N-acetylmuramoyl-tripeptide--D-alanyl-D-alanine ligase [Lentisphaerae bacterium]|nr:UDP-N-acetylmuramoyl-tripeptide--D-alanyl-D-alanine ligase [Lentisphaerota bacterium]
MPAFEPRKLAAWTDGRWDPAPPPEVRGICHDTRDLAPGDLYVALGGARFDGHAFVAQAFERGASGAVVAEGKAAGAATAQWPLLRVRDTAAALRDMARAYRRGLHAEIVGVSGSAGKTTVKEMIADVLAAEAPTARTRGNWNNDIGLPLSILSMADDCRAGVFEVGTSHPGELAPLCALLAPSWGVVTCVGPAHAEFFPSIEAIAREKAELLRCLPPEGAAVLDRQGEFFGLLRDAAPCRVVTVALRGEADYACLRRDAEGGRAEIVEARTGTRAEIRLPLPGEHMVLNALFAAAVAREHGVPWNTVAAALARFRSLPMRWEERELGGVRVVNDAYNANLLSMRAAVRTFAEMPARGRRWVVLGGMLELGAQTRAAHAEIGRAVAAAGPDALVTVGELGAWIADGAEAAGYGAGRVRRCADAEAAANALLEGLRDGDVVLLKASRNMRLESVVERMAERWGKTS